MNNYKFSKVALLFLALTVLVTVCTTLSCAQATTPFDVFPIPTKSGVLGRQDQTALTELDNHRKAVGSALWIGLQGTGQIVYGSTDPTSYPAVLSNFKDYQFRLDVQTPQGEMSTRVSGPLGKLQFDNGRMVTIANDTALAGLLPFELVRQTRYPSATALIDRGLTSVDGVFLRRVSLERPTSGRDPSLQAQNTIVTDFYFDPDTHLLAKSATYLITPDSVPVRFLVVDTYSDYRNIGSTKVPFHFDETIAGELVWSLQLDSVDLAPTFDPTYFTF